MTRTFLLAITLPDDSDLTAIAEDISFLLSDDYDVSSVKPWAEPLATPSLSPFTL